MNGHQEAQEALTIVGPGRVGTSMARAAATAGSQTVLVGRGEIATACAEAEVVLLCVPDEAIATACEAAVAAAPGLRLIGHTSGAGTLAALAAAQDAGIARFSLHPLQTVPDADSDLRGAPCAISGSGDEALETARDLALTLGMKPFEVSDEARAAYHAAAAIASNFLVALEESAVGLLERAGVEDGRELLSPLVLRSAANWSERGAAALTGPIARGDESTIALHLEAIAEFDPGLLALYEALAERTRALVATREGAPR